MARARRLPALFAGLALVLGGVVAAGAAGPGNDRPPSEQSAWKVPSARVRAAVDHVDRLVRRAQRETGVPGIGLAIVHRGRIVKVAGYGLANTKTRAPVDGDTIFELASVSKSVGATVIARQASRGQISWTDPLVKHTPDFALSDPWVTERVTIEDMYAHRSGLPDHAGDALEDLGYDRAEVLRRLRYVPLDPFRATYHYTNFGMTAGAEAVATAAGMSWEDLSEQQLYGPLGMTRTSSRFDDFAKAKNHADLHVRAGKRWVPRYERDADAQSPAGGVSASARDMARWMRMVLAEGKVRGKQFIEASELELVATPHMTTNPIASLGDRPGQYGLGMNVSVDNTGRPRLGHSGAFALGAGTTYALSPREELGIVVLSNGFPIGVPEAIAAEFLDEALVGTTTQPWLALYRQAFAGLTEKSGDLGDTPPSMTPPPRADEVYLGTYANDFYGPLRVVERAGQLVMVLGPQGMEFPLEHWTGDTFAYRTEGENAVGTQAVEFTVAGRRAAQVKVVNLNGGPDSTGTLGVFVR